MNAVSVADVALKTVEFFTHGTTVVINALMERKGVKTALITTKGFRDILEIGRGKRPDFFNIRYTKPEPFAPRYLRRKIDERMTYNGVFNLTNAPCEFNRASQQSGQCEDVQLYSLSR